MDNLALILLDNEPKAELDLNPGDYIQLDRLIIFSKYIQKNLKNI